MRRRAADILAVGLILLVLGLAVAGLLGLPVHFILYSIGWIR